MSSEYEQLLEATIQHLESLRNSGIRHVQVSPETLRALSGATPRGVTPAAPASEPAPAARPAVNPLVADRAAAFRAAVAEANLPVSKPKTAVASPTSTPPAKPTPAAPAISDTDKNAAFADLRARAMACVKCPNLASSRKNVVFGVGNTNADLMFVGEAPGADEDEQGEPFVGKAGQLLTRIIETMGIGREDVYIANILKCRPDTPGQTAGNRKPTPEEMATCIPYLHEQIDLIKPKVLVALGGTAMEGLLNKTGITKLRGHWHEYRGIPLMPTYHPSYLLRNQAMHEKRKVWEDMLQVMEKLGLPITEKQRNFFLRG